MRDLRGAGVGPQGPSLGAIGVAYGGEMVLLPAGLLKIWTRVVRFATLKMAKMVVRRRTGACAQENRGGNPRLCQ